MCTVAVVAGSAGGYIVAHNRDERRARSRGLPPMTGDSALLCPRDPDGGGTWVGVNRAGLALCMLNAPDPPPESLPASPVSRGTIPLQLANVGSSFELNLRMTAIDTDLYRPFHLVAILPGEEVPEIVELRWNGEQSARTTCRAPVLFVSSSLHQLPANTARGEAWRRFVQGDRTPGRAALSKFMENHLPEKSSLSTCMHREDAATVSRTVIEVGPERIVMAYTDGPPCDPESPTTVHELSRTDAPR